VRQWLRDLMRAGIARRDIPADVDVDGAVTMLMIIADGVWWRRALDPDFDPQSVLPVFMDVTRHMLRTRGDSDARKGEKPR
jgi:TetR/AcrR family transcriptional regulator, repressor for uid operon